jgi:UDP-N-acetylglucosamine/UDP-N-acetylgalactosamine diphosphorylase
MCTTDFLLHCAKDPESIQLLSSKQASTFSAIWSYHAAKKKNRYYDTNTRTFVKPETENSYKFELFYFDIFSLCPSDKFAVLEVKREEEFAPVKNAPGSKEDCPETARKLSSDRDRVWLEKAGMKFEGQDLVEISPKLTYFGENLSNLTAQYLGKVTPTPFLLQENNSPSKSTQIRQEPFLFQ